MKRLLNRGLGLVTLSLGFVGAELLAYQLGRAPLDNSLNLASPGPLALGVPTLLDRVQEWMSETPELRSMAEHLLGWTLAWVLLKHLGFPWMQLRLLTGTRHLTISALCIQSLYFGVLTLPLLAALGYCAAGLGTPNPRTYTALGALIWLFGLVKISRERSLALLARGSERPWSLRWALRGLGGWIHRPGIMVLGYLLWLAQMASAAVPIYTQVVNHPGPSAPRHVLPYVATSILLWALRLWLLLPRPTPEDDDTPPATDV